MYETRAGRSRWCRSERGIPSHIGTPCPHRAPVGPSGSPCVRAGSGAGSRRIGPAWRAVHNIGRGVTRVRAIRAILSKHRSSPFGLLQSFFSGACGLIAASAARVLGIPHVVHVAGGEPVRLADPLRRTTDLAGQTAGAGGPLAGERADGGERAAARVPRQACSRRAARVARRVPLGVACVQAWPARAPSRRPAGGPARLLHVANLNRVKDQRRLCGTGPTRAAAARVPDGHRG